MTTSMTAFVRQSGDFETATLVWELRSLNHRYLDISFKLPDNFRALEPDLRQLLQKHLCRGKVECLLKVHYNDKKNAGLAINQPVLVKLIATAETIQSYLKQPAPIDPLAILQWPGTLTEPTAEDKGLKRRIMLSFQSALDDLSTMRQQEGAALKQCLDQRLTAIEGIVTEVHTRIPVILEEQRHHLRQRFTELQLDHCTDRLEQEIVVLLHKADVAEELDRLATHVTEIQRILNNNKPCGRRLDFLMQELHREANTLSSKSIAYATTQASIELRVLIDEMREHVQNIE